MIRTPNKIRPAVYGICLYFLLTAMDCFQIGSLGSILKIVAFVPLALLLLDVRQLRLRAHPLLTVQLLFWLLAVLSIFYSIQASKTFSAAVTLSLNWVLVFALGITEQYTERELHLMERALFWGGWLTALLMVFFADFSDGGRLTLKMGIENQDQNYLNGYFIYAYSWHFHQMLQRGKQIHIIPTLALLALVLMTGSRGALLAFALVGFALLCVLFAKSRHWARNILLVAALLVLMNILFDLILKQLPENVAVRYSWEYIAEKGTTGRTRMWKHLLEHFGGDSIPRMLFGHGYGTTMLVNQDNGMVAHNLYLDNLITLGILGVVLQLVTQGIVAVILIRRKRYPLLGAYVGMIGMCISLSLTAYKPIWNIMLLVLAVDIYERNNAATVPQENIKSLLDTEKSDNRFMEVTL